MYDDLAEVARSLAFDIEPSSKPFDTRTGVHVKGTLDGIAIDLTACGDGDALVTSARLPLPLDLGLALAPRGRWPWSGSFEEAALPTGDPAFDDHFRLHADEPDRAVKFCTDELKMELDATRAAHLDVHLTDGEVSIRDAGIFAPQNWGLHSDAIVDRVRRAQAIVNAMDHARTVTGPPVALSAHVTAWARAAADLSLTFTPVPMTLSGSIRGGRVMLQPRRIGKCSFALEMSLAFDPPIAQSFSAYTRVVTMFGAPSVAGFARVIPTGDPAFDQSFIVNANDEKDIAALLDDVVRGSLLEILRVFGRVEVDRFGLAVHVGKLEAPRIVDEALDALRTLSEQITTRAAQTSAYR